MAEEEDLTADRTTGDQDLITDQTTGDQDLTADRQAGAAGEGVEAGDPVTVMQQNMTDKDPVTVTA